jgi:hypothetical protein
MMLLPRLILFLFMLLLVLIFLILLMFLEFLFVKTTIMRLVVLMLFSLSLFLGFLYFFLWMLLYLFWYRTLAIGFSIIVGWAIRGILIFLRWLLIMMSLILVTQILTCWKITIVLVHTRLEISRLSSKEKSFAFSFPFEVSSSEFSPKRNSRKRGRRWNFDLLKRF